MNILNFIVIEGRPEYYESSGDVDIYEFTVQGECYIPLETPVPVSRRGSGCIGVGIAIRLSVTKTATTVYYTIADVSETNAKAYYDLYLNQATASNSEEYREDVIIPGMMRNISTTPRPRYSKSDFGRRKKENHRSLMDYPNAFDED